MLFPFSFILPSLYLIWALPSARAVCSYACRPHAHGRYPRPSLTRFIWTRIYGIYGFPWFISQVSRTASDESGQNVLGRGREGHSNTCRSAGKAGRASGARFCSPWFCQFCSAKARAAKKHFCWRHFCYFWCAKSNSPCGNEQPMLLFKYYYIKYDYSKSPFSKNQSNNSDVLALVNTFAKHCYGMFSAAIGAIIPQSV